MPGDMVTSTDPMPVETTTESNPYAGASAAITALGGISSAWSQFQAGKTNQSIARFNANYARLQAKQAREAGDFAAQRRRLVQLQLSARTQSGQAGGGTVVNTGTNRLITKNQETASASDQYMLKLNAGRQALADEVRATGDNLQGDMARRAGEAGAIGSLLNTGSNEWLIADRTYNPRFGRGMPVGGD